MTRRTAFLCAVAATALGGCYRTDGPLEAARSEDKGAPLPAGRIEGDRLAEPVPVEADGRPLVRQGRGYALEYPFVGDLDGDGRPDLLLGDRQRGRLRVYRNVGTAAAPRLAGPTWFDEMVPTGKVPYG
jgi:hypothetical protein